MPRPSSISAPPKMDAMIITSPKMMDEMVVFTSPKMAGKQQSCTNNTDDSTNDPRFSDDDENWTKLQDIASRRRIQNRISQRKRRRRLKENSISRQASTASTHSLPSFTSPSQTNTPKPNPRAEKESTYFAHTTNSPSTAQHHSPQQTRSRQNSVRSQGSILDKQDHLAGPQIHHPPVAGSGSWDQQFFDQAFMSDVQGFEGAPQAPVPFLYEVPAYSSDGGSVDGYKTDYPEDSYDELFNPALANVSPFTGGSELCLTPPSFDYANDPMVAKGYPIPAGIPTPPESVRNNNNHGSIQSTPETISTELFADISGNTALHIAAEKGHAGIVQLLLDTGIHINATNKDGMSALHIAVSKCDVAMSSLLLEKGAFPDIRNNLGQNMLHIAVEKGNIALVQLLLDYASDHDSRDCLGQTAFHRAVAQGYEEIVRLMLMRGVNSQAKVGAQ